MSASGTGSENKCGLCGKPAVIRLSNSKIRLCSGHFIEEAENRVYAHIRNNEMISPGDRILVGLSGGKDSTALLLMLHSYLSDFKEAELVAVTVDEGISGYREETVEAAVNLASELGIEHHIISFDEIFDTNLDKIVAGKDVRACSVCGVLRRRALIIAAKRFGATKIATGHNLDDEAQSVLMNLLRGDLPTLMQDTSSGYPGYFIPRIKPLSVLFEKEIITYLLLRDFYRDLPECPYAGTAMRLEVRIMLAELEQRHSGTKGHLMKFQETLKQSCSEKPKGKFYNCRICGEISSSEVCQVCRLLKHE
ncbi:TIGR00269 family protein [Methanomicrobium antiquum]|uniref:TIGR00269 family protein n=1 Tax=Methanomicrobium antiquum TaxID=487686 RepID=A0AAF0JN46_9EURY|nr:TIGR00269 family protein [Methanomicrobium antiquum]WFN37210.1 TIGR00269 family protein [Methanomicrobium antiquum]